MSTKEANKLIGRIKRTSLSGKGIEVAISDTAKALAVGSITVTEANAVNRVAKEQLRKFDRELRQEKVMLREELQRN